MRSWCWLTAGGALRLTADAFCEQPRTYICGVFAWILPMVGFQYWPCSKAELSQWEVQPFYHRTVGT